MSIGAAQTEPLNPADPLESFVTALNQEQCHQEHARIMMRHLRVQLAECDMSLDSVCRAFSAARAALTLSISIRYPYNSDDPAMTAWLTCAKVARALEEFYGVGYTEWDEAGVSLQSVLDNLGRCEERLNVTPV